MKTVTQRWGTCLAALGVGLALVVQAAAQAPTPKPAVAEVDVVKLTATVEAIDKDKRTVTVKGPAGRSTMLRVAKAARNFDQIQVGDKVAAEYIDAVAVFVRKAGAPPHATGAAGVDLVPKGAKPAGLVVETVELAATVENINYDRRLVTLRGPAGDARTVKVAPKVENLRQVQVGDELVIRHTEALAIAVLK